MLIDSLYFFDNLLCFDLDITILLHQDVFRYDHMHSVSPFKINLCYDGDGIVYF